MTELNSTWQERHASARARGTHPVALLLDALHEAVNHFGAGRFPDANTSLGLGQVLEGVRTLLNENLEGMDGGSLWSELDALAETIGWDLDMSKVSYS